MLAFIATIAVLTTGTQPPPPPTVELETASIVLTIDEVRVRAAKESAAANSLAREIHVIRCSQTQNKKTTPQCSTESILGHLVEHQRGLDAAAAMIVAYKIVAIDRRLVQLDTTGERLKSWRQAIRRLISSGQSKIDDAALQEQEDRLPDARTLLLAGRLKLQIQLGSMLNFPINQAENIEIHEPLDVLPGEVDAAQGIADALCLRRDLIAVRQLCPCINEENLDSMRKLLGTLQPGIGIEVVQPKSWLQKCHLRRDDSKKKEVELRRKQCQELTEARQRQIRTEVVGAGIILDEAYERLRLAEQFSETAKQRVSQQKKLSDLELKTGAQVIRSELESLAAEDVLLQRQLSAREAEIMWSSVQEKILSCNL